MNQNKLLKILFYVIIIPMFAISYINGYRDGIQKMKDLSMSINASVLCLTHLQISDDNFSPTGIVDNNSLAMLYPDPDIVRSRIKILSELGIKFKTGE